MANGRKESADHLRWNRNSNNPSFNTNINFAANLAGLPSTLMRGIQVEQDINCRVVGRCSYGNFIDREVRDLTCREAGVDTTAQDWREAPHIPLDRDLGRALLYARYNADLSAEGLDALGCSKMDPEKVQKLDAVEQVDNLLEIGFSAGEKIKLERLGAFGQPAGME